MNPQWGITVVLDDEEPRYTALARHSVWVKIKRDGSPKTYDEHQAREVAQELTTQARGVATYVAQEIA